MNKKNKWWEDTKGLHMFRVRPGQPFISSCFHSHLVSCLSQTITGEKLTVPPPTDVWKLIKWSLADWFQITAVIIYHMQRCSKSLSSSSSSSPLLLSGKWCWCWVTSALSAYENKEFNQTDKGGWLSRSSFLQFPTGRIHFPGTYHCHTNIRPDAFSLEVTCWVQFSHWLETSRHSGRWWNSF